MRKFLSLTAFAVLTTTSLAVAQDNENYNQYENQYAAQNAEMPATMAPTREVLMQDYNNRTYLKENTPNYGVRSNGDASDLTWTVDENGTTLIDEGTSLSLTQLDDRLLLDFTPIMDGMYLILGKQGG